MLELDARSEAEQACQACKLMADVVVVLKMILETPLIVERAQAQVAGHLMTPGVLEMVLDAIAVFEDAFAEVAVVFVFRTLLDVVEKRGLIRELE